jgi:hypothetical protein
MVLLNGHVVAPETPLQEANYRAHEFEIAGLAGAIGSMDATHVCVERVSFSHRQAH